MPTTTDKPTIHEIRVHQIRDWRSSYRSFRCVPENLSVFLSVFEEQQECMVMFIDALLAEVDRLKAELNEWETASDAANITPQRPHGVG